ncbi:hypothetical protein D1007_45963 [Hordeum vulgare]|nr:hypothetical protein D1007_45963 [Hordeum vulgare]
MVDDKEAKIVFNSMVKISLGKGEKILFWKDRWLHGFTVGEISPGLWKLVATRARNSMTVQQGMINNAWTEDVAGDINFTLHIQFANLCLAISIVPRNEDGQDQFHWLAEAIGVYTAKATYSRMCMGKERDVTSLARMLSEPQPQHPTPTPPGTFRDWWFDQRRPFSGKTLRGFDSFVIGTTWALWKQRNARAFNGTNNQKTPVQLIMLVLERSRIGSSPDLV